VLEEVSATGCDARIASGGGRMYLTMDRCGLALRLRYTASCADASRRSYEADWSMVQRGWAAHVLGRAEHSFTECVPRARPPHLRR